MVVLLIFSVFFIFAHYVKAAGSVYYVANAGNDACDGTSPTIGLSGSCAWKTVVHVNAHVFVPGDVVYFNKGDTWNEVLNPTQNGTSPNPIVFSAYGSGALPHITGGATAYSLYTTGSYQEFRNIYFTNTNSTGIAVVLRGTQIILDSSQVSNSGGDGILLDEGASFITISNNTVSDNGQNHTGDANNIGIGGSNNAAHDITISGNDVFGAYKNNIQISFTDTGATPYNILVTKNKIHSSVTQAGLSFDAAASSAGTYNLIYDNATHGILVAPISYPPVENVDVDFYHNTVVNNTLYGVYINTTGGGTATVDLKNNIIAQNDTGGAGAEIGVTGTGQTFTSDYNVVYHSVGGNFMMKDGGFGTWAQWKSITLQDAHSINSSPLFSNIVTKDFTLQTGSPAIDSGFSLDSVYTMGLSPVTTFPSSVLTINQVSNGSGWDIGAFVFPLYTVGGSVSGLNGTLVLQNNGGDNVSITTDGSFVFSTATSSGALYAVTILNQPSNQECTVTHPSGSVSFANITDISVSCVSTVKTLVSFSLNGLTPAVSGTVDEPTKSVTVTVPFGTSLSGLVPTVTYVGASVSPGSGSPQTFTQDVPFNYTVIAANGSTQIYSVTISVAPSTAHTIVATAATHSSISPVGAVMVEDGNSQVFTISADSGYHVSSISIDGVPTDIVTSYTFTSVTADHTISVAASVDTVQTQGTGSGGGGNGPIVGSYVDVPLPKNQHVVVEQSTLLSVQHEFYQVLERLKNVLIKNREVVLDSGYVFNRNLSLHDTGEDVRMLQKFLNNHGFIVADSGTGSHGKEVPVFGLLTYKALVRFQASAGLSPSGYFGDITRGYVVEI